MIDFLYYLMKVSGIFVILYLVYFFCFSQLTFHNLNRAFLIGMIPLSLIIPILNIQLIPNIPISKGLPILLDEIGNAGIHMVQSDSVNRSEWNTVNIFLLLYSIVVFILLLKLLLNAAMMLKMKHRSATYLNGKFSVISANVSSIFSCFNWIFLPQNTKREIADPIIEHEKLHGISFHTFDLIAVELFVVFFWFNPFVYLFRRDIKSVHEFQIDDIILKGNLKTSKYLQLMLDNLECSVRTATFCSSFNGSTIKKRVTMITKNKSSKWKSARYLILIPLIAFITMAFSIDENNKGSIPDSYPIRVDDYKKISSGYGMRIHPVTKEKNMHYGMDFVAKTGTPIIATAHGIVTRVVFLENGYGKLVEIDHDNSFTTRYAQLNEYAVNNGDNVKKGDIVGYAGQSGRSTGPHLHYEVLKDGVNVNPDDYIKN